MEHLSEQYVEKINKIIYTFSKEGYFDKQTETYEFADMIMRCDNLQEFILVDTNANVIFSYDSLSESIIIADVRIIDSICEIIDYENDVIEGEMEND